MNDTVFKKIVENKNDFVCLGDLITNNQINSEIRDFLMLFTENYRNSLFYLIQFGAIEGIVKNEVTEEALFYLEKDVSGLENYLSYDGEIYYSIKGHSFQEEYTIEQKKEDIIGKIHLPVTKCVQFSELKRNNFNLLHKFIVKCSVKKSDGSYLQDIDLMTQMDNICEDDIIRVQGDIYSRKNEGILKWRRTIIE